MTANEQIVFRAAAQYLETYGDPPAGNGADAQQWWAKAADALCSFGNIHENHPLALKLGVAIYEYIEIKAKAVRAANLSTEQIENLPCETRACRLGSSAGR